MAKIDHMVKAMEKAQSNMVPPKPLPQGERQSTREVNIDGVMDFLDEGPAQPSHLSAWDNVNGQTGYPQQYQQQQYPPQYPQGYNQGYQQQQYPPQPQYAPQYPNDDYAQQIINRQPQARHQLSQSTFNTSEDLYNQFKSFILGPVSTNPEFDFPELLDILDDMKEMTEVLEQQKTRRRKVSSFAKGNKYLKGVSDEVYDNLDDEVTY